MIATNSNSESSENPPIESTPHRRKHPMAAGLVVGLAIALLLTVGVAVVRNRQDAAPRLTSVEYEAAVRRWEANGPASYEIDVELAGNRGGTIHVEVRDGEVVRMTRDGVEPRQRRTWDVWSVPGMFETIGQEMEMARHPAESFGARGAAEVVMWAEFDSRYGYPRRYDRVVLGADIETHWRVTNFAAPGGKN